jgi:hypothetical protein
MRRRSDPAKVSHRLVRDGSPELSGNPTVRALHSPRARAQVLDEAMLIRLAACVAIDWPVSKGLKRPRKCRVGGVHPLGGFQPIIAVRGLR